MSNINMADVSKAQKLASARKKFKELKKEKKKNTVQKPTESESDPVSREATPETVPNQEPEAALPAYFNINFNQQPEAFFDTFVQHSHIDNTFTNNYFKTEDVSHQNEVFPNVQPLSEDNKNESEIRNFQAFDTFRLDQTPSEDASVESLRQISDKMAQLINPEVTTVSNPEEEKVEELTSNSKLHEYQSRISQLESQIREGANSQLEQEVISLREQLQCHIQTVGILVAEKTELVANLSQFQLSAKQKNEECEELKGRLKTSRSRVADLEREISHLKSEKTQYDTQNFELENMKKNYESLKMEREELVQDLLEVREKLKTSSENNLIFQQQIGELSNQLALANIKIQQLTTGEVNLNSGQVEQLTQEKFNLEKQIADLNHTIKSITKERDESSLQYQQYAQQLNSQISSMATRLEKLQKENESLQIQEQNRIKHLGELEKQLQNLQNDQVNAMQKPNLENRAELDAALELIEKLKNENSELQAIENEKEVLVKELETKNGTIKELEALIEQLRDQPDTSKLLAVMESDKVAASRAVSQNTELKKQMESMQEVFMKMNNDKIDLIEKLTTEQNNNRELFEKLQKTELHLQTLAEAIEIKDKELQHLRENSLELDKKMLQSEQLNDRLRHYEAQDNSSQALQNELQESKQIIARLTSEIESLRLGETKSTDSNHNDYLDRESAMKHLEAKFLKTMEEIAVLTEEKQRLEHLVLQLQGETETIGEYVALYQQQRSLLKQKAIEKDQQLSQLANDREIMKSKLEKLNELVRKLVLEKGAIPQELLHQHDLQKDNLCEEHAKLNKEINKIAEENLEVNGDHSTETAEEIIALLSEIKSSNLVQPTENFHHCPWCSGQLITV